MTSGIQKSHFSTISPFIYVLLLLLLFFSPSCYSTFSYFYICRAFPFCCTFMCVFIYYYLINFFYNNLKLLFFFVFSSDLFYNNPSPCHYSTILQIIKPEIPHISIFHCIVLLST